MPNLDMLKNAALNAQRVYEAVEAGHGTAKAVAVALALPHERSNNVQTILARLVKAKRLKVVGKDVVKTTRIFHGETVHGSVRCLVYAVR